MNEWILRLIGLIIGVASPELRKMLEQFLNQLEQQSKLLRIRGTIFLWLCLNNCYSATKNSLDSKPGRCKNYKQI